MWNYKYTQEPLLLLPPRNCLSILCLNTTAMETRGWIEVTNYICYVLVPVILVLSLLGQVINVVVLAKQIRLSIDTYFFVLSITTLIHVITSIFVMLPHYIEKIISEMTYYSVLCHEWTRYIIIWIILSAALERTLTVTLYQTYNQVSSTQSWIISGLVIIVGLISTVPRLWQYDITNYNNHTSEDYGTKTNNYWDQSDQNPDIYQVIQETGKHAEYDVVYFWYLTCIFIGLPILLMFLSIIGLCTSVNTSRPIDAKYRTETALILNRRLREEIQLTKLIIKLMFLYTVLMFPLVLANSIVFLNVYDIEHPTSITVTNVLSLVYHVLFIIQQQLYFCYNKQYRLTFISLCCCCC